MKVVQVNRCNYPDDKWYATVVGKYILFVKEANDPSPSNPLDDDGMGEIYGLGKSSYSRSSDNPGRAQCELSTNPDAVPLTTVHDDDYAIATLPGHIRGVWVPDEHLVQYALDANEAPHSSDRRERMRTYAQQACSAFNLYVNGEVYGYDIRLYRVRRAGKNVYDDVDDYRFDDDPEFEESCWGFLGREYFQEEVTSLLEHALKATRRRKAA